MADAQLGLSCPLLCCSSSQDKDLMAAGAVPVPLPSGAHIFDSRIGVTPYKHTSLTVSQLFLQWCQRLSLLSYLLLFFKVIRALNRHNIG